MKRNILRRAYQKRLIPWLRKELGIDRTAEEILTLLDSAADITQCRPATGKLRSIQLADTELLRLFDLFCRKNDLTYWLDWGTLLGAVRHRGFIPWDDDLDVCMPREDFQRAAPLIAAFFADRDGFFTPTPENAEPDRLWVNYWTAGILIDIFPIDSAEFPIDAPDAEIAEGIRRIRDSGAAPDGADTPQARRKVWYYTKNVWNRPGFFFDDSIFPLQTLPFEQYEFSAPGDCDRYLTTLYGNYMAFPRGNVLHHGGLTENASFTEVALCAATDKLKEIQTELAER